MLNNKKKFILAVLSTGDYDFYTPVHVQKLFFLIERLIGLKFFNFIAWHYGCHDKEIYQLLKELSEENYIIIDNKDISSRYFLTKKGFIIGRKELNKYNDKQKKNILRLNNFVHSISFSQLVATIYKHFPEMKVNGVFVN
jgi:hypothetical protein